MNAKAEEKIQGWLQGLGRAGELSTEGFTQLQADRSGSIASPQIHTFQHSPQSSLGSALHPCTSYASYANGTEDDLSSCAQQLQLINANAVAEPSVLQESSDSTSSSSHYSQSPNSASEWLPSVNLVCDAALFYTRCLDLPLLYQSTYIVPNFLLHTVHPEDQQGMGRLWLAQSKLDSEVAYFNARFWTMVQELEVTVDDPARSEYLIAAAERYRREYRAAKARLGRVEAAIEAVIEYTFRRRRNPSLPLMGREIASKGAH